MGMLDEVRDFVTRQFEALIADCDSVEEAQVGSKYLRDMCAAIDSAEDCVRFCIGLDSGVITPSVKGDPWSYELWDGDVASPVCFVDGLPVFTPEQRAALEEARNNGTD